MNNDMSKVFNFYANRIIGAKIGVERVASESEQLAVRVISDDVAISIQDSTVVDAITLGLNHENTCDLFFLFNATTKEEILYVLHKNQPTFDAWIQMIRESDCILSPRKAAK